MVLQSLMDNFIPDDLLFRKDQSEMIEKVFERYKNTEDPMPINIILIGTTGAGKTFTLKNVISKYPDHIYISAAEKKKSNQIISMISNVDIRKTDILLTHTAEYLKKVKKVLIVDELNRIEDTKTFFDDLNTIFRKAETPIILITNNPLVINNMQEDAKNTLFLKRVIFTKYGPGELREICLQRINELPGQLPSKMEVGTLNYICALASQSGSARKALNLVRGCYLDDEFDIKHAKVLAEQEECMDFKTFINSMNEQQRKFLMEIKDRYEHKRTREEGVLTSKDLQEALPNMNKSKISQLITEFEEKYGFIETSYVEMGRGGGRYREIRFANQEIIDRLEEAFA